MKEREQTVGHHRCPQGRSSGCELSHDPEAISRGGQNPANAETILLALSTGMRLTEIAALTWKNVDLERKAITFRGDNGVREFPISGSLLSRLIRLGMQNPQNELVFDFGNQAPANTSDRDLQTERPRLAERGILVAAGRAIITVFQWFAEHWKVSFRQND